MSLATRVLDESYKRLVEDCWHKFPWTINQLLQESDDKKFELKPLGIINKTYFLEINGRKYGYEVAPHISKSIEEVVKSFNDMLKTNSRGEALAWLRSATKLVAGSVKGVSPLAR